MQRSTSREEFLRGIVVAIDGPAGSGKTTTARGVSRELGLRHIDTGAMYRAVAWKVLERGVDAADERVVGDLASTLEIEFSPGPGGAQNVLAGAADVTDAIRSPEVTRNVSMVSSHGTVRKAMVRLQRRLAASGGVVLEGRDIGTVVLPSAHVKVFLVASTDERARRRLRELQAKHVSKSLDEVKSELELRDHLDSSRELSPLKVPVGAHIIDTTALSIDEQVGLIVGLARDAAERLGGLVVPDEEKNPFARQRPVFAFSCAILRLIWRAAFGLRLGRSIGRDFRERFIYACNHRSNVDPPLVGSMTGREVHIMAKDTLFDSPVLGPIIRYYNAIPTRRGRFDRAAFVRASEVLERGGSLLIFPEGTRSRGDELGSPKAGVGYLALQTRTAVVPVYLSGAGSLREAFFRRKRLIVSFGDPIRADSRDTSEPTPENCREFTRMVMTAIDSLREELR
jgi:cytidylate kinase